LAADAVAASADSRTTVRIVPSIGFNTAWYAAGDAAFSPSATLVAVRSVAPFNVPTRPRKIWLRMTPLLPRAPIKLPWLMALHVGSSSGSPSSSSRPTASSVRAMLVPVSPSVTGYTFSRLIPSACTFIVSRNVITVLRNASGLNRSNVGTPDTLGACWAYGGGRPLVASTSSFDLVEEEPSWQQYVKCVARAPAGV